MKSVTKSRISRNNQTSLGQALSRPCEIPGWYLEYLRSPDGGLFTAIKPIGDNLYAGVKPLLYHWTMIIGEIGDTNSYTERFCYANQGLAEAALAAYSGAGEPVGWHRHPNSGRRRPGGDASKEYIAD